ncbi:CheR family methyltransferase [Pontibacter sp. HJ8]
MTKSVSSNSRKNNDREVKEETAREVMVIGIGASAGGLQALTSLFNSVPNDSVAYVIVQHLSSEHRSLLRQMVAQQSVLEVVEAQQDMPVEVNKVYVIPHNKELIINHNHLQLCDKASLDRSKTIDTFFRSLAADKDHQAVGIVLSGTGSDGTEGVVAIKKAGGIVMVQDPATAKFEDMPRNAINTGYADYILSPEEMPQAIGNLVKEPHNGDGETELVNHETESSFLLILDMIHERSGIDFSNYKRPTIIRRISRRMALTNIVGLIDYLDYLQLHPEEVEILSKDLLIGVTKFFRDEEAYKVLANEVIPVLIDMKNFNGQLRVWVAGCSTGEEAYSLAILIREYMDIVKKELEVKIFASDIDREALDFAGKGVYPLSSLSGVSKDRLQRYFVKEDGKYRINQRVRRMVIFAPHNVINDPPFSKVDLVTCRNMLIYLNPVLQKKVIDKFHYGLLAGGYLFLGSSESIGDQKSFVEVNKKWKIYCNAEPTYAFSMDTLSGSGLNRKSRVTTAPALVREQSPRQLVQNSFSDLLNETILEEYGYAAVFIDEHYDVLHGVGRFKNFLDLPEENFTFNLLKLVPHDLSGSLATTLRKATRDKEKVSVRGIQVRNGNIMRSVNVVVKPYLADKKLVQKFILVLFAEDSPAVQLEAGEAMRFNESRNDERLKEMEVELQHTKEDLQTVVEELETSNEELQSTNEELLSSNEELQSTNEELQSLNEELHTINAEHQYKIKALVELDDDLNNYFRSTNIGQIFVDRQLIIRKYTPIATNLINLIESDIGRSINHISNNLRYEHLIEDTRRVISDSITIEKEVQDKNGTWYQMRILPYITQERSIDGAIIIFIQINELKNLQLLHAGILDSSPSVIIALKAIRNNRKAVTDFNIRVANHTAQEFFNCSEDSLIGRKIRESFPQLFDKGTMENLVQTVETGELVNMNKELVWQEEQLWVHLVAVKFDDGLVLTLHNITENVLYERAMRQQQEETKENAERFRTLVEAVPHITWTNKPNGESESFNEYWFRYTGLTAEESAGWGWEKAFHPDDLKKFLPVYKKSMKTGDVFTAQARILRKADKQYRCHLLKDVPIRNEAGEITLWIGTATDIQDHKDAEESNVRLQLSQQRELLNVILQTQEEERSRISEALHNGLGQILYAAKLNLSSILTDKESLTKDSAKAKENVEQLLTQGIKITRDISFELTPAVLKEFGLKTAVEEVISRMSSSHLKISSKITGLGKKLNYNVSISLYRIIQELLNNIVKHSKATLATVELTSKKEGITLHVTDNGIGIDRKQLDRIKGRGLSSIQKRVELLEGNMEVKAQPGKGTSVLIHCKV